MKYIKEYNSYNDVEYICRKYGIKDYTINTDGSIDVDGSVNLAGSNLGNLPLNFNKVTGDFLCYNNQLTSLEGCPKEVTGFYCFNNKLISLEGCPKKVTGNFNCSCNQLISLKGCPKEVGDGYFNCGNNQLTSLEGCPKEVGERFFCGYNRLPKLIVGNMKYIKGIIKWQDDYSIWRKDGSLDEFRFNDMMIDIKNDED